MQLQFFYSTLHLTQLLHHVLILFITTLFPFSLLSVQNVRENFLSIVSLSFYLITIIFVIINFLPTKKYIEITIRADKPNLNIK